MVDGNDTNLKNMTLLNQYDEGLKASLNLLKAEVDQTNMDVQTEIKNVDQSQRMVKQELDKVGQDLQSAGPLLMTMGGFTQNDLGYLKTFATNVQEPGFDMGKWMAESGSISNVVGQVQTRINEIETKIRDMWDPSEPGRELSSYWTGRTYFELLKPKPPYGFQ